MFNGRIGTHLTLEAKTDKDKFILKSKSILSPANESCLSQEMLTKKFRGFHNNSYRLQSIDYLGLDENTIIPFKEVTSMKKDLAFLLNGSVKIAGNVEYKKLPQTIKETKELKLSILISDEKDSVLSKKTNADIYFRLPESFKKDSTHYIDILKRNPNFIPWFAAVMIGKDYDEAVKILEVVKPKKIITNNTGIAFEAYERGIKWIAGPLLNTTNSHALRTLKKELNCSGAFISNEINKNQIRNIKRPENFKLIYSIYHPILLMTSRQCFFQRTVGCNKPSIDPKCMLTCEKATTITNIKGISFAVDKQKGGYPSIYNHEQFLNIDIVNDLSSLFDEFFIDLTDIGSGSKEKQDKIQLLKEFEKALSPNDFSKKILESMVSVSTNDQYIQGL